MIDKIGVLFGAALFAAGLLTGARAAIAPATVATQCGAPISSVVLTDSTADIGTSSATFVPLPGAEAVITVPSGGPHCVKVRFSASTSCSGGEAPFCDVQVQDNGIPAHPKASIEITGDSQILAAHAFEWVRRVSAGTHTIRVMISVEDTRAAFLMSHWTMKVQLTH